MLTESQAMTILVVDDDEGHCELIRRNLHRGGVTNPVIITHSGHEALAYVNEVQSGKPTASQERLLVLLDINMPGGMNGLDVLSEIKSRPATRKIPVIMLTTTDDPREISRCYDLGCNVYITKPIAAQSFIEAIKRLGLFISIVSLAPTGSDIPP